MLKKGRKREAKGLAVLYFIIGLIILLIILAVIYFALAKLDYSDKLDPDTVVRPYVEQSGTDVFQDDADADDGLEDYAMPEGDAEDFGADDVDLTVEEEATPEPTPEPTEEPTPEPTEEPTPEPTALPTDNLAQPMTKTPDLPPMASENGKIGITNCYVSQADDNKLMYVAGYGYVDEATFDGAQAKSWLVVTQMSSNQNIAYPLTLTDGVSGLAHPDAQCQNATASDFEITIDVSQYQEGIYSMALVIAYQPEGEKKPTYKYYPFSGDISFTVLDGRVITPISATEAE